MRTIEIRGTEHETVHDALVELNFSRDRAISISGRVFTVNESEFRRLEDLGLQPTTWHHDEETEEMISVPGKH